MSIFKKVLSVGSGKLASELNTIVASINNKEQEFEKFSDQEIKTNFQNLSKRLEDNQNIEVEAFAYTREAAKRTLGQRHYDVQIFGGLVLLRNKIAEMKTGEGKTLVSTLPISLMALYKKGVHVVTVNDYLAKRDAEWMSPIYENLGMSVSFIIPGQQLEERKAAYEADVIYATNNELGFDFLRNNMVVNTNDRMMNDYYFAIIDEVDSILIDEARTPLVISGPAENTAQIYQKISKFIPKLEEQTNVDSLMLVAQKKQIESLRAQNDANEKMVKLAKPSWYENKWLYFPYGAASVIVPTYFGIKIVDLAN